MLVVYLVEFSNSLAVVWQFGVLRVRANYCVDLQNMQIRIIACCVLHSLLIDHYSAAAIKAYLLKPVNSCAINGRAH